MAHFGFPLETIIVFFAVILFSIYMDLVAHKNSEEITVKKCGNVVVILDSLAVAFYVYLYIRFDASWADLYLAGYVLEKVINYNLMVFVAIFASFGITGKLQHRILYWGIFRGVSVPCDFRDAWYRLIRSKPLGWLHFRIVRTLEWLENADY